VPDKVRAEAVIGILGHEVLPVIPAVILHKNIV
jgi:hypothetical protein